MTYLISNCETAEDIIRYSKSGTVEVPEWAMKLLDHIDSLNETTGNLETELWLSED